MSFCPVALYDIHSAIEGRLRKKEMTSEASNFMIDTFVDTMGRRLSQFGGIGQIDINNSKPKVGKRAH